MSREVQSAARDRIPSSQALGVDELANGRDLYQGSRIEIRKSKYLNNLIEHNSSDSFSEG